MTIRMTTHGAIILDVSIGRCLRVSRSSNFIKIVNVTVVKTRMRVATISSARPRGFIAPRVIRSPRNSRKSHFQPKEAENNHIMVCSEQCSVAIHSPFPRTAQLTDM